VADVRLRARISGRVQGVFYRASTEREARALGLHGWVRNCPDGTVELVAEGSRPACEALLEYCRHGPPAARVQAIEADWQPASGRFDGFGVRY
jgi:acylphosphatase